MNLQDVQFLERDSDKVKAEKLRIIVDELQRLKRRTSQQATGGTAPADSDGYFLVYLPVATLSNARKLVPKDGLNLDITVAGEARIGIDDGGISFAKLQTIVATRLVGRSDTGDGAPEQIQLGSGLTMLGNTLMAAVESGYPPQLGYARI